MQVLLMILPPRFDVLSVIGYEFLDRQCDEYALRERELAKSRRKVLTL
jgi:hypothetical protein